MKLNVLLAKTDTLASSFRACVNDFSNFFSVNKENLEEKEKPMMLQVV